MDDDIKFGEFLIKTNSDRKLRYTEWNGLSGSYSLFYLMKFT